MTMQFDPKLSTGNVITLMVYLVTGVAMFVWGTFQIEQLAKDNELFKLSIERLSLTNVAVGTKLAAVEATNNKFDEVRDTARSLEIRVQAVEEKSDEIRAVALEMREIKGELKGIAEAIRRVDRVISRGVPPLSE